MASIPGIKITGAFVPTDTADIYATHDSLYGRGGLRVVADITTRNNIPVDRRAEGMLVYISGDTYYTLQSDLTSWEQTGVGAELINDSIVSLTKTWSSNRVKTQIDSLSSSVFWQVSVIAYIDNTQAPPSENLGDRYILDDTGGGVHADWDGAAIFDIVEFDGANWVAETPIEGWRTYVDAENYDRRYIGGGTPMWDQIFVGLISLNDIADVTISALPGPVDNEILGYDSVSGYWINQNANELNLYDQDDINTFLDGKIDKNFGGSYRVQFSNAAGDGQEDHADLTVNSSAHLFAPYLGLGDGTPNPGSTVIAHSQQTTGNSYWVNETLSANDVIVQLKNSAATGELKLGSTGHMDFMLGGNRVVRFELGCSQHLLYLDNNDRIGILQPTPTARLEMLAPTGNGEALVALRDVDNGLLLTINAAAGIFWDAAADTGFYKYVDGETRFKSANTPSLRMDVSGISGVHANSFYALNYISSAIVPTLIPNRASPGTGHGGIAGTVSTIIDSVTAITVDVNLVSNFYGHVNLSGENIRLNRGGDRFLHDFKHPTGDTAIPLGKNIFLGEFSGNLTLGSTATTTSHGSRNVGLGAHSLMKLTTGYQNSAVGVYSLYELTTGYYNAALGYAVLDQLTTGFQNVGVGYIAGRYITGGVTFHQTGTNSVFLGASTKAKADGETNQIVIGYDTTGHGSNTVTIGNNSITGVYFSSYLYVDGIGVVDGVPTVDVPIHISTSSAIETFLKIENTNVTARNTGVRLVNTSQTWDIYTGTTGALHFHNGATNDLVLHPAGALDLPEVNQRIDFQGNRFLHNFQHLTGDTAVPSGHNTFIGREAGNFTMGSTATSSVHGSYNVGISSYTLAGLTTGYYNVAGGYASMTSMTTGNKNTAWGHQAGRYISGGVTANITPSSSVYIGYNTQPLADGDVNEIVIGASTTGMGSNTVTIGNDNITDTYLKGIVHLDSTDIYITENGFVDLNDVTLSFVDGTRTFTITRAAGDYVVFSGGVRLEITSDLSVVVPDAEGNVYMYIDSSGVLQSTPIFSLDIINVHCYVAYVYWDATNSTAFGQIGDERHGRTMDSGTHSYLHEVFGTAYISGLALGGMTVDGNGNDNIHAQLSVGSGIIRDEDIRQEIISGSPQTLTPIAQIPIYHQVGVTGTWRVKLADDYPVIHDGTAGYAGTTAAYNLNSAGTWSLAAAGNNNFFLVHLFATTLTSQIIGILGQDVYATAGLARTGANAEINNIITVGLPFQEYTPIATIIVKTSSSDTNIPQCAFISTDSGADYIDWRGAKLTGSSGSGSGLQDHSLLNNLPYSLSGHSGFQEEITLGGAYQLLFVDSLGTVIETSPNILTDVDGNLNLATQNTRIDFQGNKFIHNFQHLTGGAAIPTGQNTFIGEDAGNTSMGSTAATVSEGSYNIGAGTSSLNSLTTGWANTGLGPDTLTNCTTGYYNTAIGFSSLAILSTGYENVAVGASSLRVLTTGTRNTALGLGSGRLINSGGDNTTSANSVFLGYDSRPSADGETNQIVIGYQSRGNGSNTVTIGNSSITKNYFNGNLGVGGIDPLYGLDVISTNGFARFSDSDTDAEIKTMRLVSAHYLNIEKPVTGFYAINTAGSNTINFGGGTGFANAVTGIGFYTTNNNTTVTGVKALGIGTNQYVAIGSHAALARLHVENPALAVNDLFKLSEDGNVLATFNSSGGLGIGVDATDLYKINIYSTFASGTQLKIENSGTGNTGILIKNSVEAFLNYVTSSGEYRVFGDSPCFRIDVAAPNTALWLKADGNLIHKQIDTQSAKSFEIQNFSSANLWSIDAVGSIQMTGTNGIFWGDTGIYEAAPNFLAFKVGGAITALISSSGFFTGDGSSGYPLMKGAVASSTNPVYTFVDSTTTGIGGAAGTVATIINSATAVLVDASKNTTFYGVIRINPSALPVSPTSGMIAIDSGATNHLKWYDGSSWQLANPGASTVFSPGGTYRITRADAAGTGLTDSANLVTDANGSIFMATDGMIGIGAVPTRTAFKVDKTFSSYSTEAAVTDIDITYTAGSAGSSVRINNTLVTVPEDFDNYYETYKEINFVADGASSMHLNYEQLFATSSGLTSTITNVYHTRSYLELSANDSTNTEQITNAYIQYLVQRNESIQGANVTNLYGTYLKLDNNSIAVASLIDNMYGLYIDMITEAGVATNTNAYGIYIKGFTGTPITARYGIYTEEDVKISAKTIFNGSIINKYEVKSANYTLTISDNILLCNSSTGSFTVTLPPVSASIAGLTYHIKHMSASTGGNTVTIDGNASETIDTATTIVLAVGENRIITNDGNEWHIIG